MDFEKHFHKRRSDLEIRDNYQPIQLIWEDEFCGEVPVLRDNFMELQARFHIGAVIAEAEVFKNYNPWSFDK